MQDDILLEAEEVAQRLRIATRTVKRMAAQGQLPAFKIGGQWRFRQAAIDRFIAQQEQAQSIEHPKE